MNSKRPPPDLCVKSNLESVGTTLVCVTSLRKYYIRFEKKITAKNTYEVVEWSFFRNGVITTY